MAVGKINSYAVILAGGSGERLWPMSTTKQPKQFLDIFGGKPLICHAVERISGLFPKEKIIVLTSDCFVSKTRKILPMLPKGNIIGEPCRRNTAAAVALALGLVKRVGGVNAVCCILTADHLIEKLSVFRTTISDAIAVAEKTAYVVTIGITPTYPATGFGYIESGDSLDIKSKTVFSRVKRFVEKPNEKVARKYLSKGSFRWNSGMFISKVAVLEKEFAQSAPDIGVVISGVSEATNVRSAIKRIYANLRSISFDYAVMEKAKNIIMARGDFIWDDVGTWLAIPKHFPRRPHGNTVLGNVSLVDTSESIVISDKKHPVVVMGLSDVVVVHTQEATLVCSKSSLREIKKAASIIV